VLAKKLNVSLPASDAALPTLNLKVLPQRSPFNIIKLKPKSV
jgi:hypothetical protein